MPENFSGPLYLYRYSLLHEARVEDISLEEALGTALEQSIRDPRGFEAFKTAYTQLTGNELPSEFEDLEPFE